MNKHEILIIIGTRPELIKLAPVVLKLKEKGYHNYSIVNTGQHRELLEKYWKAFNFHPDYNLNIISPGQDLSILTAKAINTINELLVSLKFQDQIPKIIIAQGDTTTVMASSIVAFYHGIPFFHLEAGLRSYDLQHPFPEEFNRRVAGIIAAYHLSPTILSEKNLLKEGIKQKDIAVVGNTVIDSINIITKSTVFDGLQFIDARLNELYRQDKKFVLITCHRRENQNQNLINLIEAVEILAQENESIFFIWPVHANPKIKDHVLSSSLSQLKNVLLIEALEYMEILKLMQKCVMVFTDSGGIQEEAPSFKLPVLILREKTERPEAVEMGYSVIVGCNKQLIIDMFYKFKPTFPEHVYNPYGDGEAADRIVKIFKQFLLTDKN